MGDWINDHFEHVLCALVLVARLGDIVSTYLVTPTLRLEGNLLARKLGWRFALVTVLVCLIPYYSTSIGVVVLVPSVLVSASNVGKIWFVRAFGERRFADLLLSLAATRSPVPAIAGVAVSSAFIMLAGAVLLFLCPDPEEDWGCWFAVGIIAYGLVILLHGSLYYWRLFKRAKMSQNQQRREEPGDPGVIPEEEERSQR